MADQSNTSYMSDLPQMALTQAIAEYLAENGLMCSCHTIERDGEPLEEEVEVQPAVIGPHTYVGGTWVVVPISENGDVALYTRDPWRDHHVRRHIPGIEDPLFFEGVLEAIRMEWSHWAQHH